MASPFEGYEVDTVLRPKSVAYAFDLEAALSSVVALEASVPADAFTASSLGTDRLGNGVVIGTSGLVLTVGYLIMEADTVLLTTNDGRRIPAHVLGADPVTGFGLVHALEPLNLPALLLGDSKMLKEDDRIIIAGAGGRAHAAAGRVLTRAQFAGYWEYLLDDAIMTEPAHPHWSGAALIGSDGGLMGIGSLAMHRLDDQGEATPINLCIPCELLPPILDDLARGKQPYPPRPWLGIISQDADAHVRIASVTPGGPADRAELRQGDVLLSLAGSDVGDLANLYTRLWALGSPGVSVPLRVQREGDVFEVAVRSGDRTAMLKKKRLN